MTAANTANAEKTLVMNVLTNVGRLLADNNISLWCKLIVISPEPDPQSDIAGKVEGFLHEHERSFAITYHSGEEPIYIPHGGGGQLVIGYKEYRVDPRNDHAIALELRNFCTAEGKRTLVHDYFQKMA